MPDLADRLAGALAGFALGDCLGAPALLDREAHQAAHGRIGGPRPAPATHPRWPGLAAGRATWLGEQAAALLPLLAAGEPWPGWTELPPLPGTPPGALPATAWPAALWGLQGLVWTGDPPRAAQQVLAGWQGPPLQSSARSALAMAAAALAAAAGGDSAEAVLSAAQAAARLGRTPGPAAGTSPSLPYRLQLAAAPLRDAADMEAQAQQLYDFPGASELAAEAVPTALAIAEAVGPQPVWAALYAANLGGEAALIGAMAAGVAGAMAGAGAFSAQWLAVAHGAWPGFDWQGVVARLSAAPPPPVS